MAHISERGARTAFFAPPQTLCERVRELSGMTNVAGNDTVSLFDTFSPAHHTLLLFSNDVSQVESIIHGLRAYTAETFRSAIIATAVDML